MATSNNSDVNSALFQTAAAFVGALLVIPLLFKTIRGLFRLSIVRKILVESILIGLTTLLTKEGVLDKLFGPKGARGKGLLKPEVKR